MYSKPTCSLIKKELRLEFLLHYIQYQSPSGYGTLPLDHCEDPRTHSHQSEPCSLVDSIQCQWKSVLWLVSKNKQNAKIKVRLATHSSDKCLRSKQPIRSVISATAQLQVLCDNTAFYICGPLHYLSLLNASWWRSQRLLQIQSFLHNVLTHL